MGHLVAERVRHRGLCHVRDRRARRGCDRHHVARAQSRRARGCAFRYRHLIGLHIVAAAVGHRVFVLGPRVAVVRPAAVLGLHCQGLRGSRDCQSAWHTGDDIVRRHIIRTITDCNTAIGDIDRIRVHQRALACQGDGRDTMA